MQKQICVIGSSNVDMIMKMKKLPAVGETLSDGEFSQTFGGKGANQAVAAARAGSEVIFINCVGNDAYALTMLGNFKKDGIDCAHIFIENDIPSGHALVMVGADGSNYLAVSPGANYRLSPERIAALEDSIARSFCLVMQYEIPPESIRLAASLAAKHKVPLIWNFAPAREFINAPFSHCDYLVVNESEAESLSGIKVSNNHEAETAADILIKKGCTSVIITLGKAGVFFKSWDESLFVPAFSVVAEDTTAAGDTWCGAFACALSEGKKHVEAIRFASAAAAISVCRQGAQPSIPYRKEIDEFLARS